MKLKRIIATGMAISIIAPQVANAEIDILKYNSDNNLWEVSGFFQNVFDGKGGLQVLKPGKTINSEDAVEYASEFDVTDGKFNTKFGINGKSGEYLLRIGMDGQIFEKNFIFANKTELENYVTAVNNAETPEDVKKIFEKDYGKLKNICGITVLSADKKFTYESIFESRPESGFKNFDELKRCTAEVVLLNQFIITKTNKQEKLEALFEYFDSRYVPAVTVWNNSEVISNETKESVATKLQNNEINSLEKMQERFAEETIINAINSAASKGAELKIVNIANTLINAKQYSYFSGLTESKQISILSGMKTGFDTISSYATALDTAIELSKTKKDSGASGGSDGGGTVNSGMIFGSMNKIVSDKKEDKEPTKDETPVYTGDFLDLDGFDWAKSSITVLKDKGIVNGVGNGMFAPQNSLKREEFTTMIVKALALQNTNDNFEKFKDVNKSDWYYNAVATAFANNLIHGISDDTFGAGQDITRQDVVVICERALKSIGALTDEVAQSGNQVAQSYEYAETIKDAFEDQDKIADYALKAVLKLNKIGIVNGNGNNCFSPTNKMTRAEAAVVIDRMIKFINSSKDEATKQDMLTISKLKSLGLYKSDTTALGAELTRADCAELAYDFIGLNETPAKNVVFSDCSNNNPQFTYINSVCGNEYMSTVDGKFMPNELVDYNDAIKIAVIALGEKVRAEEAGGYPTGYLKIARERGILSGVTETDSGKISKRSFIKLFDNLLEEQVLYYDYDGKFKYSDKDDNFLRVYHNICYASGKVVANPMAGICGESKSPKDCIKIDNHEMNNNDENYANMIGRTVKYYYKENRDIDTLVYLEQTKQTKVIELSSSNIDSFKNMQYAYTDEAGREKEVKITNKANFIYNDNVIYEYNDSMLNPKSGTVTLIDANGDGNYTDKDTVIINEYKNVVVNGISVSKETIYDKYSSGDDGYTLDLNQFDSYEIKDKHGDSYGLRELKEWDVVAVRMRPDKSFAELTLVDECYGGKLNGTKYDDELSLVVDDRKFELSKDWRGNENDFILGKDITVYWDLLGKVTAIKSGISADAETNNTSQNEMETKLAVLARYGTNDDDDINYIDTYCGDRKFNRQKMSEKVKINGRRFKDETLFAVLESQLGRVILIESDNEGLVTDITTAALPGEDENRGLWQINYPGESMLYKGDTKTFGNRLIGGDVTYTVPSKRSEFSLIDKYAFNNANFNSDRSYIVDGYTTVPNSVKAEVVVYASTTEARGSFDVDTALVVSKITTTINEDDEVVKVIEGLSYTPMSGSPSAITLELDEKVNIVDSNGNILDGVTVDSLDLGDCIKYGLRNGKIDTIMIAYDYSNNKVIENSGNNSGYVYSGYAYQLSDDEGYLSVALGIEPGMVDITSKDSGGKYINSFWIRNSSLVTVVDTTGKKTVVKAGTMKDIQTYVKTKSGCSKVVLFSNWQSFIYGIVVYVE